MVVRDEKENDVDRWIAFYADITASMCAIPEQACEEYGSRDAQACIDEIERQTQFADCEITATLPKTPFTAASLTKDCKRFTISNENIQKNGEDVLDSDGNVKTREVKTPIANVDDYFWYCNSWPFNYKNDKPCIQTLDDY